MGNAVNSSTSAILLFGYELIKKNVWGDCNKMEK